MVIDPKDKVAMLQRIHMFRDMDEQLLEQVVPFLDPYEYAAGQTIFQAGDPPDYFYIIFSGQVKLSRAEQNGVTRHLGTLQDGDYFGQELLNLTWPREISAAAETPVTVLRISAADFRKILEFMPVLGARLQMILDSYRLMLRSRFKWLSEGEYIYYIARRHVFFLFGRMIIPTFIDLILIPAATFLFFSFPGILSGIGFLLACLLALTLLVWTYVDWANDYYVITTNRIVYQERVVLLYDSRQETPLDQVQSSSSNTSQFGRIFGYGNVVVRSFFSTILLKQIAYPGQVMFLLQDRQFYAQTYQRWNELKAVSERLGNRFVKGPQMPKPPKPPKREARPSELQQFLSTLLNVRYEVAGSVIYRTHILLLIQKVFMPLFLLIGLVGVQIANAVARFPFPAGAACALSGLVGTVLFGWLIYRYYDWHYDVYIISPDQIIDVNKKPLGHEERRAAQLDRIQNIEYKQNGIIALIFNYGTVFIQVGDQKLTFDDVHQPADIQRELFRKLSERKRKTAEQQLENDRQRLEDWIATYDLMKERGQLNQNQPPKTRAGF